MRNTKKLTDEWGGITGSVKLREREQKVNELECGPMPNVMVALPNIGGALC